MKISRTTFRTINTVIPAFYSLIYFIFYLGVGVMSYLGLMLGLNAYNATDADALVHNPIFGFCATAFGSIIIIVAIIEAREVFARVQIDESDIFGYGAESLEVFPSRHSTEDRTKKE